jgi:hypothetical protein
MKEVRLLSLEDVNKARWLLVIGHVDCQKGLGSRGVDRPAPTLPTGNGVDGPQVFKRGNVEGITCPTEAPGKVVSHILQRVTLCLWGPHLLHGSGSACAGLDPETTERGARMPAIDQIADDLRSVESLIIGIGAREGLRPHRCARVPAIGAQKAVRKHDELVVPDSKSSHREERNVLLRPQQTTGGRLEGVQAVAIGVDDTISFHERRSAVPRWLSGGVLPRPPLWRAVPRRERRVTKRPGPSCASA